MIIEICKSLERKNPSRGRVLKWEPDGVLLSHGETPHYHRR